MPPKIIESYRNNHPPKLSDLALSYMDSSYAELLTTTPADPIDHPVQEIMEKNVMDVTYDEMAATVVEIEQPTFNDNVVLTLKLFLDFKDALITGCKYPDENHSVPKDLLLRTDSLASIIRTGRKMDQWRIMTGRVALGTASKPFDPNAVAMSLSHMVGEVLNLDSNRRFRGFLKDFIYAPAWRSGVPMRK